MDREYDAIQSEWVYSIEYEDGTDEKLAEMYVEDINASDTQEDDECSEEEFEELEEGLVCHKMARKAGRRARPTDSLRDADADGAASDEESSDDEPIMQKKAAAGGADSSGSDEESDEELDGSGSSSDESDEEAKPIPKQQRPLATSGSAANRGRAAESGRGRGASLASPKPVVDGAACNLASHRKSAPAAPKVASQAWTLQPAAEAAAARKAAEAAAARQAAAAQGGGAATGASASARDSDAPQSVSSKSDDARSLSLAAKSAGSKRPASDVDADDGKRSSKAAPVRLVQATTRGLCRWRPSPRARSGRVRVDADDGEAELKFDELDDDDDDEEAAPAPAPAVQKRPQSVSSKSDDARPSSLAAKSAPEAVRASDGDASSSDSDDDYDPNGGNDLSDGEEIVELVPSQRGADGAGSRSQIDAAPLSLASQASQSLSGAMMSQARSQNDILLSGLEADEEAAYLVPRLDKMCEEMNTLSGRPRRKFTAPLAFHLAGSPEAERLICKAEWLPPTDEQLDLLSPEARRTFENAPHLVPELLRTVDVVDIVDFRKSSAEAKFLNREQVTTEEWRDYGGRVTSNSMLIVSTDTKGLKAMSKDPDKVPATQIICLFLSRDVEVMVKNFGSNKGKSDQRCDFEDQCAGAEQYCSSTCRGTNIREEGRLKPRGQPRGSTKRWGKHWGDMFAEGFFRNRWKVEGRNRLHTYAHKKGSNWRDDKSYTHPLYRNCTRLSNLEATVAPRMGLMRLAFRKDFGIPGLNSSLGDKMSAPAYMLSIGYASPMHKDKTAACFPEAIVWMAGQQNPDFDWQFAIPVAQFAFALDRAWPCFCLLQAHDVLHGTLFNLDHPEHDNKGLAAVSRDVVSNKETRDALKKYGQKTKKTRA
ncbi:hypothetical protein JL720_9944 [Aureococcus anophagefferens]|nr:hypothetical protein JL720_9944 [Aureococcus anophagefferens]